MEKSEFLFDVAGSAAAELMELLGICIRRLFVEDWNLKNELTATRGRQQLRRDSSHIDSA